MGTVATRRPKPAGAAAFNTIAFATKPAVASSGADVERYP